MNTEPVLVDMVKVAREAGDLLLGYFRGPLRTRYKGVADLVTEADTESERFILQRLKKILPKAYILAEESGGTMHESGLTWVVDPLDGTTNFAHGFPWFCISIALVEDGEPVLGVVHHPALDELYRAGRGLGAWCNEKPISVSSAKVLRDSLLTTGFYYHKGAELRRQIGVFERVHQAVQTIRRPGSAALDLAYVAAGYFEAFWEKGLSPWDVAAGYLLVREAGGVVSDYSGNRARIKGTQTVASNRLVHEELLAILNPP